MQNLLKVLLCGLLLLLAVALGTEVVALHRSQVPGSPKPAAPVVVRKAPHAHAPPKTVRQVKEPTKKPANIPPSKSHKKAPTQ
ncbi:hypothetical protein Q3A66_05590 [Hymenobacter sp. BT770]|uniref:hypothetical protein n=1 Tax=Hymenobacter sp. BT770 TaxID=2886942 RepID=UPI001D11B78B|nr:hypothetical protein [Hymenobacter sp. BT770]MCC3152491.1 hypothetical protein [Hymenobacter sp. BT770]MDO3414533.1 hypothetical protein [Hymenobacter sp. BT770]